MEMYEVTVLRPTNESDGELFELADLVSVISIPCENKEAAKTLAEKIELSYECADYEIAISPKNIEDDTFDLEDISRLN